MPKSECLGGICLFRQEEKCHFVFNRSLLDDVASLYIRYIVVGSFVGGGGALVQIHVPILVDPRAQTRKRERTNL